MERIALADKFFEKVKDGSKTRTVRYGWRQYELGECEFYSDTQKMKINIDCVCYCSFGDLDDEDAQKEGYATKEELQNSVREFYPHVKNDDTMTIVWFTEKSRVM